MTDFDKVRAYYRKFDEENRLKWDASGQMEYEMTMRILRKHLPGNGRVLDLGGAAGVYSFALAEMGYDVYLADLSEELIRIAREKDTGKVLRSCEVVNATDLSAYGDGFFDVVLAFGPFYHLTAAAEREAAVSEIRRVLKPGGTVLAAFIPYLSGSIAIVDRYVRDRTQVNMDSLAEVFASGRFANQAERGFQEGYYAESSEVEKLFSKHGFAKAALRSVRGFAYEREERILSIDDPAMREKIINLIEETASRKEILETCGHAIYVGMRG